jgi:hypothetical protein
LDKSVGSWRGDNYPWHCFKLSEFAKYLKVNSTCPGSTQLTYSIQSDKRTDGNLCKVPRSQKSGRDICVILRPHSTTVVVIRVKDECGNVDTVDVTVVVPSGARWQRDSCCDRGDHDDEPDNDCHDEEVDESQLLDPDSADSPSLTVPIVGAITGTLVVAALVAFVVKRRAKRRLFQEQHSAVVLHRLPSVMISDGESVESAERDQLGSVADLYGALQEERPAT